VTLDVVGPIIELSTSQVEFVAMEGGPDPNEQILTIRNSGGGTLNWEILESCDWLTVDPCSGNSTGEPDDVTLSVDISVLDYGIYGCSLTILDPCAMNSPETVEVTLRVIGPIIELSSSEFDFIAFEGGANPADQIFTIQNGGALVLNWKINEACDWLEVNPTSGRSGEPNEITLSVDISGLEGGTHSCDLIISDPNAQNNPYMVNVELHLVPYSALVVPNEYSTIQAAINAAVTGDTVIVMQGTYTGSGNRDISFGGKAITVRSIDPVDPAVVAATVIDCQELGRGFRFHNYEGADSVLNGLTITHGYDDDEGGAGIICESSSPTIINCVLDDNDASYSYPGGGGMMNHDLYQEPPIFVESNPTLINCTFSYNRAEYGGGMANEGGSPTLINCKFMGNVNTFYGGGGMENISASPTLTNCLFAGNSAFEYGAGTMYNWGTGSNPILRNCTIVDNADTSIVTYNNLTTLIDCILWGDDITDAIDGAVMITYSNIKGLHGGEGNINADPMFVSGPSGDYYLSQTGSGQASDSPCVNTGSDTSENLEMHKYTTRTDRRADHGIVDMGYHYLENNTDFNIDGYTDLDDVLIMGLQWLDSPGVPSADIAPGPDGDGIVNGRDFSVVSASWEISPDKRLAGHWKFDGDATDSSRNGRDGTLMGDATFVDDPNRGQVLSLGGSGDYVRITGYKGVTGTQPRTCCAWIKTAIGYGIMSWGRNTTGEQWAFQLSGAGSLQVQVSGGTINAPGVIINDDQWHHVAVVWQDDGMPTIGDAEFYIDGQKKTSLPPPDGQVDTASDANVCIGRALAIWYFNGRLDDVRIYEAALSDNEIAKIYQMTIGN
ncbi:MAG: LamG-like jellyroll fold domain-containing protein, partial [Planctomycetota bacterium]|jgi:hypothetical protein